MKEDIFDLMVSERESEYIKKVGELEAEIIADFVEEFKDFPFVGPLIKLGKIGVNYMDLHFVRKIGKFLSKSEHISNEKKERFLQKLDGRRRKKLYEYLVHFLYVAENDEKAEIMGYVYGERVLDRIDDEMLLRLCAAVNKSFVDDLRQLGAFVQPSEASGYIADNLSACGLLTSSLSNRVENTTLMMSTSYQLNDVGRTLHNILNENGWF